jgi:glycine cleavage system H lipoate-binding protein
MEEENPLFKRPLNNIIRTERFMDRYTTRYITEDEVYYNIHTNNLLLIGLSESLIAKHKKITKITFRLKDKYDDMDMNKLIQGKKKRGGIPLSPKMKLFEVEFEDGFNLLVRCRIKGKIIEINEEILNHNYDVINKDPENDGFFFIAAFPSLEYSMFKDYSGFKQIN